MTHTDQHSSRFGSFDLAFISTDRVYSIFELKLALRQVGGVGTAASWTFFLFIYDCIALWLERLECPGNDVPSVFGVAIVDSNEFSHQYREDGDDYDSVWRQAFPETDGQYIESFVILNPSAARANPGQGVRVAARLDEPQTLTRNQVSSALTGGLAKLLGIFQREPFSIHILYRYRSEQIGLANGLGKRPHTIVVVEVTEVFVRDRDNREFREMEQLLTYLP